MASLKMDKKTEDFMNMLFGSTTGHFFKKKYCVKCHEEVINLPVVLQTGVASSFLYCENSHCSRFGVITKVARSTK
jgi:hypothetical protein